MLVSSVDRSDPSKNAIYMISPDGKFLGAFVTLTQGLAATKFDVNPTGMVIPGPEDQQFLRGLIAGSGITSTGGTFAALFFNSNAYSPGQVISNGTLPKGVTPTGNSLGTIVGLTEANADYLSPVYSAFTDFGTPAQGGIPARPGASGVQGSNGELLIGDCFDDEHPHRRSDRRGQQRDPPVRGHRVRPVRLLLAERAVGLDQHDQHDDRLDHRRPSR